VFTITINSIFVPIIVTIILFGYSIFIHEDESSKYFSGIGNMLLLIPASIISMVCWII